MTDAPSSEPKAPAPDPAAPRPPRVRGRKRAFTYRWSRRILFLVVGLIAALLISLFTLDLGRIDVGGRSLKQLAEQEGSKYLRRPMRVGKIRALLWPGAFELSDVVIEGRKPEDRPFLHAKSIRVDVNWRTLFRQKRELFLNIHMSDWQMVMEMFRDGNNLPRLAPERRDQPSGPRRFTTTVTVTADSGQYTFEDHNTPWKVVASNLTFNLARDLSANAYAGQASFKQGVVQIQDFKPMNAAMTTRFVMGEGGRWNLQHIDLVTDGAVSHLNGYVDFSKGRPDQYYEIRSTVDFARMREIFFSNAPWGLGGEGQFRGLFQVFNAGGFSLGGQFWSDQANVDEFSFSNLHGTLEWLPSRFAVTQAQADFHGGLTTFVYGLDRTNPRGTMASLYTTYHDVNLTSLMRRYDLGGLNLVGRASGDLNLTWPNGRFSLAAGEGHTTVAPPPEIPLATVELPAGSPPQTTHAGRNNPPPPLTALALGADVRYRIDPEWLTFDPSWTATPSTFVSFHGRTAWGQRSEIPFHVTSHDWQESDRVLAAVLTAFGNRSNVFTVGGRGTFDGMMTESFRAARIAGKFNSEDMYAWDVTWGRATGDLVIQNGYLDITGGLIGNPDGPFVRADGRFALGYPRKDGGEEMNARVVVKDWPLADIRKAFDQDDWPIDGTIAAADLALRGPYEGLFGGGTLRIANGVAWDESFDAASGTLKFEGTGVFVEGLEVIKTLKGGPQTEPGRLRGSAQLFWSGRFSFDAEGDRIPVESLDNFRVEGLPLTGFLRIGRVIGRGTFEEPFYEVNASVADLYLGDEGIGHVTGRFTVEKDILRLESLEVASQRLAISGTGSIKLNEAYDSFLNFVITDASLDPYLKFIGAEGISPYTRIRVIGSTQISGPLSDSSKLQVAMTLGKASVVLLDDYTLQNPDDEPIQLTFAGNEFKIAKLRLLGRPSNVNRPQAQDESLVLSGGVNVGDRMVDIRVDGEASLAMMQLFFTDLSASGTARLEARIHGPFESFGMVGDARISNGNIRYLGLPHSLANLNGPIHFAADAIDVSGLTARMGEGDVTFSGRIFLSEGYQPTEFDVGARGSSMRLRYPPGVRSTVDADLRLTGPIDTPLLSGTVTVHHLNYSPRVEDQTAIVGIGSGAAGSLLTPDPGESKTAFPLAFDITIDMETQRIIEHQNGWIEGSAHLRYTGTYNRPSLTGQIDIDSGEYYFAGNRYFVRRGTVDFANPSRIQPIFDLQAETRARVPGQTFQIGIRLSGTFDRITPTLTSDPWLPDEEIISLLLGGTPDLGRIEEQRLSSPQQVQERMLRNAGAVLLASPITSRLGSAFTEALPITNLQITPTFGGNAALQQLDPSARITVGRRISNNVYLTYSVALNDAQSELIMLEYDQSDRLSWVLSRNGDRTFALDFRIRYVF